MTCLKQAPMLLAIFLFVWSMTIFHRPVSHFDVLKAITGSSTFSTSECNGCESSGHNKHAPESSSHGHSSIYGPSLNGRSRVLLGKARAVDWLAEPPTLTIFCSPKPYTGEKSDPQRRALLSWLALKPIPKVILLGNDPSFLEIAREFPHAVSVDPNLDYNFLGVPQFHSMVARAQAADTDLSMLINGDIILLNDLMPAVLKVNTYFDNWLLTAVRWDLPQHFPFSYEAEDIASSEQSLAAMEGSMREFVRQQGSLHTYGGVDFWLWNNSPVPLFAGAMPPFTFGRSKYDNWLTHEVVAAGLRQVVDASEALTNVHVAHEYGHVAVNGGGNDSLAGRGPAGGGKNFWSARKKSSWEMFNNVHLAESHGTYTNQKGTALHAPWRLAACYEPTAGNMCLLKRARPSNCSCEYSPYVPSTQSDPSLGPSGQWQCGKRSQDKPKDFRILPLPSPGSKPGLPHTMAQLLPMQVRQLAGMRVVTLVAVTIGYADMLMNFVCRLQRLGLDGNLVIAALDTDMYTFAFNQGLAVYYEPPPAATSAADSSDCAYGTECFRQFTKLKSRAVLKVLQAGYSVLWTDVDIVWYTDPLPHLASFGPGTFPIQSNEPNASLPGTGLRRINSGFYFARADALTVQAFQAITQHAAQSKLSEQPSFYDVLCGEKGERVLGGLSGKKRRRKRREGEEGAEECRWSNGLRTIFLDRDRYPNGGVHGLWDEEDVSSACQRKGCAILHNNWIAGRDAKRERLVANGYWHYDSTRRMCVHDWHGKLHPVLESEGAVRAKAE